MNLRRVLGIVLCGLLPLAIGLSWLEGELLERGVLNKKDLPPIVGNETGTVREFLLNVWHWDAAIFLLLVLSLPSLALGIWILTRSAPSAGASPRAP